MVKIVTNENFDSFIASGLVLIDFFAEWCGPCKMLSPVLDAVASELSNVSIGKVDIDNASATAEKYGVSSIPTLILFKDGKEVDRVVGLKDQDTLVKLITKHA